MLLFLHLCIGAVLGLLLGSTASALSYRLPRELPVALDRSRCPLCEHQLGALDNVPLISYVALRGQCRYCHQRISLRYPLTEFAFALIYALSALRFGIGIDFVLMGVALFVALTASIIDLEWHRIPNRLTYPAVLVLLGIGVAKSILNSSLFAFEEAVAGLVVLGMFLAVTWISRGGLGVGDAKLAAVASMAIMALGFRDVVAFLSVSFITGGLAGVILLVTGKATRKTAIPFGPFLAVGVVLVAVAH